MPITITGAAVTGGALITVPSTTVGDPYFPYVPLLLNTTSTNTQTNNTFLDNSTNNFTITRTGTPTQGSVTPYWPAGYWSNFFSGTTQYVSVGGTTSLSANFTIEFWFFPTASANNNFFGIDDTQNPNSLACTYNAGGSTINVLADGGTPITGGAPLVLNSWNHVALVRSGSTVTVYVNGVQKATGSVPNSISGSLQIGRWLDSGSFDSGITGYLSNFRVSNTNLYSGSTFSVPTSPLESSANTLLLTLQDNRVKDNSSSPKTLTVSGSPPTQAFQPFSPAASYTAAAYGGSGYFGGSGNYLSKSAPGGGQFDPGATGAWTIEMWVYPISGTYFFAFGNGATYGNGLACSWTSNYFSLGQGNGSSSNPVGIQTAANYPANAWYYFAAVKDSSNNITLYINGVSAGTATNITSTIASGCTAVINGAYDNNGLGNTGSTCYLSSVRWVKGTAVYTATFTPPTAPLTAITNTQLLLNFTNAGIYDAAAQNDMVTGGTTQASSTITPKWGTTSMKFNGATTDYLYAPVNSADTFGSGNWTIEGWFNFSSVSGNQEMFSKETLNAAQAGIRCVLTTSKVQFQLSSTGSTYATTILCSTTLTTGVWYYLAFVRNGTAITVYLNGTSDGTGSFTGALYETNTFWALASRGLYSAGTSFNGYIQDFRITKGVARTITTPTSAFPTQ